LREGSSIRLVEGKGISSLRLRGKSSSGERRAPEGKKTINRHNEEMNHPTIRKKKGGFFLFSAEKRRIIIAVEEGT